MTSISAANSAQLLNNSALTSLTNGGADSTSRDSVQAKALEATLPTSTAAAAAGLDGAPVSVYNQILAGSAFSSDASSSVQGTSNARVSNAMAFMMSPQGTGASPSAGSSASTSNGISAASFANLSSSAMSAMFDKQLSDASAAATASVQGQRAQTNPQDATQEASKKKVGGHHHGGGGGGKRLEEEQEEAAAAAALQQQSDPTSGTQLASSVTATGPSDPLSNSLQQNELSQLMSSSAS